MTREEAINKWIVPAIKNTWRKTKCEEIMQALEQEPILDKIRAEIKEESKFCPLTEGLERALEIIDKYKAEKE